MISQPVTLDLHHIHQHQLHKHQDKLHLLSLVKLFLVSQPSSNFIHHVSYQFNP
jgi:hypothetical protein